MGLTLCPHVPPDPAKLNECRPCSYQTINNCHLITRIWAKCFQYEHISLVTVQPKRSSNCLTNLVLSLLHHLQKDLPHISLLCVGAAPLEWKNTLENHHPTGTIKASPFAIGRWVPNSQGILSSRHLSFHRWKHLEILWVPSLSFATNAASASSGSGLSGLAKYIIHKWSLGQQKESRKFLQFKIKGQLCLWYQPWILYCMCTTLEWRFLQWCNRSVQCSMTS